jgi:hypothetical protein
MTAAQPAPRVTTQQSTARSTATKAKGGKGRHRKMTNSFFVKVAAYFKRFLGRNSGPYVLRPPWQKLILTFVGSFVGMAVVTLIEFLPNNLLQNQGLVASFGATAVLCYAVSESPLAQPRNVIGGHVICAFLGVVGGCRAPFFARRLRADGPPGTLQCLRLLFDVIDPTASARWVAAALSVSIGILAMQLTSTTHPPGGATALVAVVGGPKVWNLGFLYIVTPVLVGATLMVAVAVLVNNTREYVCHWDLGPFRILKNWANYSVQSSAGTTRRIGGSRRSQSKRLQSSLSKESWRSTGPRFLWPTCRPRLPLPMNHNP